MAGAPATGAGPSAGREFGGRGLALAGWWAPARPKQRLRPLPRGGSGRRSAGPSVVRWGLRGRWEVSRLTARGPETAGLRRLVPREDPEAHRGVWDPPRGSRPLASASGCRRHAGPQDARRKGSSRPLVPTADELRVVRHGAAPSGRPSALPAPSILWLPLPSGLCTCSAESPARPPALELPILAAHLSRPFPGNLATCPRAQLRSLWGFALSAESLPLPPCACGASALPCPSLSPRV